MKFNWKSIGKGAAKVADVVTEGTPFKAMGDSVGNLAGEYDGPLTARDHAVEIVAQHAGVLIVAGKNLSDITANIERWLISEAARRTTESQ